MRWESGLPERGEGCVQRESVSRRVATWRRPEDPTACGQWEGYLTPLFHGPKRAYIYPGETGLSRVRDLFLM